MKKYKEIEFTLYIILGGILLNGYLQGQQKKEIDNGVVYEALKEIKKLLNK